MQQHWVGTPSSAAISTVTQGSLLLGSRFQTYAAFWASLYESVYTLQGTTMTILPIGDAYDGLPSVTTFTTRRATATGVAATYTYTTAPASMATPLSLSASSSYQGIIPILTFNGTSERIKTPDATYWSPVLTANTWDFWIKPTTLTGTQTVWSKWSVAQTVREWSIVYESSGKIALYLYDETAGKQCSYVTDAVQLVAGTWAHVVITYDGAANCTGVVIYVNGVAVAGTATNDGAFVSVRDTAALVAVGASSATTGINWMAGTLAGGPAGPTYTTAALSAAQALRKFAMTRDAMAI